MDIIVNGQSVHLGYGSSGTFEKYDGDPYYYQNLSNLVIWKDQKILQYNGVNVLPTDEVIANGTYTTVDSGTVQLKGGTYEMSGSAYRYCPGVDRSGSPATVPLTFTSNAVSYSAIKCANVSEGGIYDGSLEYDDTLVYVDHEGWKNTAYETIIIPEQTVPTWVWAWLNDSIPGGVAVLTLRGQVEQHITDAYTAIGNKSGTIPTQKNLANLAGAIDTISTGVDTSDGNIEPTTVLKGYKGYAKGVAVNGAIETYDGTVEDVGFTVTMNFSGPTVTNMGFYSLDAGSTWIDLFATEQTQLVLNNVKQIMFKAQGDYSHYISISGDGFSSLYISGSVGPSTTEQTPNITLTQNMVVDIGTGSD